jgi:transcriptional regulator with XRE-family HTH domain
MNQRRTTAQHAAADPIARNLRRWRTTRDLTLSALADQAGIAKSTVSLIERGQGNPSIDTLAALTASLGVPFASLFDDAPAADAVTLVRERDCQLIAVEDAGLEGEGLVIRRLLTRTGGALIEIYTLLLEHGAERHADAHVTGSVEISTDTFSETLVPGDLISFRADRAHRYRVIEGPVRLISVHEYPPRAPLD